MNSVIEAVPLSGGNALVRRCHLLLRRLRELPEKIVAENDLRFTPDQLAFLNRQFAELRLLLLED
jgi:hypothetical protein